MKQLHLGAKWQFRIGGYFGFGFVVLFFGIWLGFTSLLIFPSVSLFLTLIIIYLILVIILTEIYTQMSYTRWFYEFAKDELKIERGIIWKRYSNVPYQRIQNVDIQRGIIARFLGFSTVIVQTAGYSAPARYQAEGYIPAVDMKEAENIRSFLMKKISKRR